MLPSLRRVVAAGAASACARSSTEFDLRRATLATASAHPRIRASAHERAGDRDGIEISADQMKALKEPAPWTSASIAQSALSGAAPAARSSRGGRVRAPGRAFKGARRAASGAVPSRTDLERW